MVFLLPVPHRLIHTVTVCWSYLLVNGDVNVSHETTTMVVWIYDGI